MDSVGEVFAVGPLDIFLLFTFIGLVIYYFFSRSSKATNETSISGLSQLKTVIANQNNSTAATAATSSVGGSGFVSKMKNSGKTIAIFYGSQTGTAEEFAQRLAKDCQRHGMKAGVYDPEEEEMEDLIEMSAEIENSIAIYFLATYGEGDPTDNAIPLNDWLHEEHDFTGLKFAVFSLGNKTYEHFQFFGRYVDKRMEECGGERVIERGEGDDDADIEEDFLAWKEKAVKELCMFYGCDEGASKTLERDFRLETPTDLAPEQLFKGEMAKLGALDKQRPPYDAKNPYMATVVVNRELHKGGDRSCLHVEIDIANSGIRYEAGDHVAVYPTNDPSLVEQLAELLGVDLDQVISLVNMDSSASKKHPFPCPTTVRTALMHYLDITSTVKHHILAELVSHTTDEADVAKLKALSDKKEYAEWITNDNRHIVGVLQDLPSCKVPFDLLLQLLPRLQCRYYSISSSNKQHPEHIHITAVVVNWIAHTGRMHKGVATHWLKAQDATTLPKVPVFVRHTTFRLPVKPKTPVMMVGPGTGLAPFRGFIQERQALIDFGESLGPAILYFGCRSKAHDYIYQEELEEFAQTGAITRLSLAFSRDQPEKVYVTHNIRNDLLQVWELVKANGHIYVCGDAKNMAKDVHELIVEAMITHGEKTRQQAENLVKSLSNKGRYAVDVW